jgi:hypothetical protein
MKKFLFLIGILITLSASAQQTNQLFVGYDFGIPLVAAKPAVPATDIYKMRMWYDTAHSSGTYHVLYIYNPKVSTRSVDTAFLFKSAKNYRASINVIGTSQGILSGFDVYQMNAGANSTFDLGAATINFDREITIMNYMSSSTVTVIGTLDLNFSSATTIAPYHSVTFKAMQGNWKPISQF